jgi:hypothetical protein
MANTEKKATERKKRGKYDEKLAVKGSFSDIMAAAGKHRNKNIAEKIDGKKKP